jgi:hypothetical protein
VGRKHYLSDHFRWTEEMIRRTLLGINYFGDFIGLSSQGKGQQMKCGRRAQHVGVKSQHFETTMSNSIVVVVLLTTKIGETAQFVFRLKKHEKSSQCPHNVHNTVIKIVIVGFADRPTRGGWSKISADSLTNTQTCIHSSINTSTWREKGK